MSEVPLQSITSPPRALKSTLFGLCYRGTSLVRNRPALGPYGRPMPRVL